MSGIAGIFRRDGGPADRSVLERMARDMDYRAVGGTALWLDGPIGLVQLGTTSPLASGRPLAVESTDRFALVFAGHIDNPEELEEALPEARHPGGGDAALALRAVAAWGDAAPERIVGPFAFAAWDRGRRRLFCARDFLGMRPFFYHLSDGLFVFASDLHPLFQERSVPKDVNEGMVAEFLAVAPTSRDETLFAAIRRIVPAHWLAVAAKDVASGRHWAPSTHLFSFRSDAEAAEQLRDVLARATRACLRGHDRVAAELSGGLDSSSVVALARQLASPDRVETVSLVFPDLPNCDEQPYIDAVTNLTGGPAVKVPFHRMGFEPLFALAERFQDLPDSPNGTMLLPLRAEMRARNHRVLLDGQGGDLWLAGTEYQYSDHLRHLDGRALLGLLRRQPGTFRSGLGRLCRYGVGPLLPPWARRLSSRSFRPPEEFDLPVPPWIEPTFAGCTHIRDRLRLRPRRSGFASHAQADLAANAIHAWQERARELLERTAVIHGLGSRSPFNDRRFAEFAFALPDAQRWDGLQTKRVLRRALGEALPALVRQRSDKAEFSTVVAAEYDHEAFAALLESPRIEALGWTRPGAAAAELRALRDRPRGAAIGLKRNVWGACVLLAVEIWVRVAVRQ